MFWAFKQVRMLHQSHRDSQQIPMHSTLALIGEPRRVAFYSLRWKLLLLLLLVLLLLLFLFLLLLVEVVAAAVVVVVGGGGDGTCCGVSPFRAVAVLMPHSCPVLILILTHHHHDAGKCQNQTLVLQIRDGRGRRPSGLRPPTEQPDPLF